MPLNKLKLTQDIKQALLDQREKTDDPEQAAEDLAGKIADAVINNIKGMRITYTAGLVSATGGPVSGVFNCMIT